MLVERGLQVLSFHSVKGGVGKSTLALLCARELARRGEQVVLVDMDLTGTSLADVLPLQPQRLRERGGRLLYDPVPELVDPALLRALVEQRAAEEDPVGRGVPYLNDALLWSTTAARQDPAHDVDPAALRWRLEGPDGLWVIPSSALPNDLERILPLIYDDLYAGFLEGRLEWLLARLLERWPGLVVVFDSPPTIPGLSAALLSLAMRLPRRIPLVEGAGWSDTPGALAEATVRWTPVLVSSDDIQDLRATDRWLTRVPPVEQEQVRVVINRPRNTGSYAVSGGYARRLRQLLEGGPQAEPELGMELPYAGVLAREDREASHLFVVWEDDALRLFKAPPPAHPALPAALSVLLKEVGLG